MIDPLELTRRLVAIPSPTGDEGAAIACLAETLEAAGYTVARQTVTPGRDNLYAYRDRPVVVLSTHIDCVPPYVPLREDGVALYGRGTCDAKGVAAAMVAAADRLATAGERRIGLLFVVGEENGSDGALAAAALEPKGRFLVNGEPTDNVLTIGQKGALRVDLAATGRAAHSAYPDEGRSAIDPLLETIRRIQALDIPSDALLGAATMNVGLIAGGVAPNVIAPAASAQILIRTVAPSGALRARIAAAAEPGVTIAFPVEIPAYKGTAPDGWETAVVSFASDLPFHAAWGERFQMGPGSIRVAHTGEERLDKCELEKGIALYVRLARDLIARDARDARDAGS